MIKSQHRARYRSPYRATYSKYLMWGVFSIVLLTVSYLVWSKYGGKQYSTEPTTFGVTFSTSYAESLGLDWRQAYLAVLDDLQVKRLRIPVYWNQIEQSRSDIVLDDVVWMLEQAEQHDAKVILVVGRRVPRWPECHVPAWAADFSEPQIQHQELKMIARVVSKLKDYPAIDRWQVQNEPFFKYFGECAEPDADFIAESVRLVRQIDPTRQIVITDSGELSTWIPAANLADVLGISLYRVTWNPLLGYLRYPLPPAFYSVRADLFSSFVDDVIVTELQVEPWVATSITETPLAEQYALMNPDRFRDTIDYVRQTDFKEVYLWGVEWWYWLKVQHNDPAMWETSRSLFINSY